MWIAHVNRRQLVDVLQDCDTKQLDLRRVVKLLPSASEDAAVYWRVSPKKHFEFPAVIVIQDDQLTDFLAWSSTYVAGASPLTAFCRVISSSDALLAQKVSKYPGLNRAQNACIGLILGELRMLAGPQNERLRHAFVAHRATHAFAIARGIAVYGAHVPLARWSAAWRRTRRRSETAAIVDDLLLSPWSAIADLLPRNLSIETPVDPRISNACHEVRRYGDISPTTWEEFASEASWLRHAHHETTGPRESRVAFVESALESIRSSRKKQIATFVGAYLLSRVSPGSFDHAHLVSSSNFYEVLPWYGLLAGLHERFSLGDEGCLRHLLLRELIRKVSLDDYPDCDSSYEEYQITGRVAFEGQLHRVNTIEVLPGVSLVAQQIDQRHAAEPSRKASSKSSQGSLFKDGDASSKSSPRKQS